MLDRKFLYEVEDKIKEGYTVKTLASHYKKTITGVKYWIKKLNEIGVNTELSKELNIKSIKNIYGYTICNREEVKSKILKMISEGFSINQISKSLNMTDSSIRYIIKDSEVYNNLMNKNVELKNKNNENVKKVIDDLSISGDLKKSLKRFNMSHGFFKYRLIRYIKDEESILKFKKYLQNKNICYVCKINIGKNRYDRRKLCKKCGKKKASMREFLKAHRKNKWEYKPDFHKTKYELQLELSFNRELSDSQVGFAPLNQ